MIGHFWQDLRYGARMLARKSGFTVIAVLTLAPGIGANTAIFTWLKAIFLQPLPGVAASQRLVTLHSVLTHSGNRDIPVSYPDYKDYRDRNEVFSGLAAFELETFNLLDGAGLFIRSLAQERKVNLGFDSERALLVSMDLFPNGYDEKRGVEFYRQLVARVMALPGVEAASLSSRVPPLLFSSSSSSFELEGYVPRKDEMINIEYEIVAPRYFQTMRIPLVEGREFSETDQAPSSPVAIVNETLARHYWAGQRPIGRRLRDSSGTWRTVVGVARDIKYFGATEPAQPWIYQPLNQQYNPLMTLIVRAMGNPWQALASVRHEVRALDGTLPLFDEQTLQTHSGVPLFLDRLAVIFLSVFGLLALTLAAIGLYGVVAYTVTQRTREIGIRMALGAQSRDVLKLVVKQGLTLALIGVVIGLMAALALTRWMKSLLFGVSETDPATFAVIALLLIGAALLACYLPARRAVKVDPMVALQYE